MNDGYEGTCEETEMPYFNLSDSLLEGLCYHISIQFYCSQVQLLSASNILNYRHVRFTC